MEDRAVPNALNPKEQLPAWLKEMTKGLQLKAGRPVVVLVEGAAQPEPVSPGPHSELPADARRHLH